MSYWTHMFRPAIETGKRTEKLSDRFALPCWKTKLGHQKE